MHVGTMEDVQPPQYDDMLHDDLRLYIVTSLVNITFDLGQPPAQTVLHGSTITIPVTANDPDYAEFHATDIDNHLPALRELQHRWNIPSHVNIRLEAYTISNGLTQLRDFHWMAYATNGFARHEIAVIVPAPAIYPANPSASLAFWHAYIINVEHFTDNWTIDFNFVAWYHTPPLGNIMHASWM